MAPRTRRDRPPAAPCAAATAQAPVSAWILKTEPAECSLDDIRTAPGGVLRWDGIRNFQARNNLRRMRPGQRCLVYHSGIREPAIVGEAVVASEPYPDPAQFDAASAGYDARASASAPRWFAIDLRYVCAFLHPLSLAAMRGDAALAALALLRQGRLSVSPVSVQEWHRLERLLRQDAG